MARDVMNQALSSCYKVKNAERHRRDVCIQLWFVFLDQQRFKNLQPPPIVTANDLGAAKVNPMILVGLQWLGNSKTSHLHSDKACLVDTPVVPMALVVNDFKVEIHVFM